MDTVKAFNAELSSLYESKPPISKAKMTALTRGAIKAIKFYKHVVQSVEKFILKCKPEYKIPGLYVIDSIVRQSRHQFGIEKDVFAPRFAKNIQQTFVNLYKCPQEDKSKIIRVLNLWQKNQVFPPDVIQPLIDLAVPNNQIYKDINASTQSNGHPAGSLPKGSPALQRTPTRASQGDPQQMGLNFVADSNVLMQLQQLQKLITGRQGGVGDGRGADSQVHFDKKLLDFDYGDDDDEANPSPKQPPQDSSVANLLTNPEVLRQLQTLQQTMAMAQEVDVDKLRKLQEMKQQEDEFDKHLAQTVPNLPFASECEFKPGNLTSIVSSMPPPIYFTQPPPELPPLPPMGMYDGTPASMGGPPVNMGSAMSASNQLNNLNNNDKKVVEVINLDHIDDDEDDDVDNDSRSPSQDRRRRRSRSRSRDRRDRRSRRSRSRSRNRRRRSRSRGGASERRPIERVESEREKERKRRGLPVIRREHLSVCSTTLWVGHLSKLVHQDDLSDAFGEFGDVVSIDLIPPRGCAFIVMHRRQDAARCLAKLKNRVIHGKAITLAWAPGKGVKGKDLKDYWEGDLGVSYVPWGKIKPDIDLEMLEDGGMIDEDTMPDWMRAKIEGSAKHPQTASSMMPLMDPANMQVAALDTSQPPPMPAGGLLQTPLSMPLVPPFQFNNRLLAAPPNMLSMVSMAVPPPPNLQTQLMTNPLLGLSGSPFQNAAANLMGPPPISLPSDNSSVPEISMKNIQENMLSINNQTFNMIGQQHMPVQDDNMDIEMEDAAGRSDLSSDLPQQHNQRDRSRERDSGRRERRGDRRRSRSRDRDRRDRRGPDRNRRGPNERGGGDGGNKTRLNRWSSDGQMQPDRKDRERSLNERLQEMASGGITRPKKEIPPADPPLLYDGQAPAPVAPGIDLEETRRDAGEYPNDYGGSYDYRAPPPMVPDQGPDEFRAVPPPLMDDYQDGPRGARGRFGRGPRPHRDFHHGPPNDFYDKFVPRGNARDEFPQIGGEFPPRDEFGSREEFGPPNEFGPGPDEFGPRDEFRPRDDFIPRDKFGPRDDFGPREEFGPVNDFIPRDDFQPMDEFGHPVSLPLDDEFDYGPRDRFRGGRMRTGSRDFGGPRMRGGPMGRGFQRGGARGRHGPWNDRGFDQQRFDNRGDFFRGGRSPFEDGGQPRRWSASRFGCPENDEFPMDDNRQGRKSRWGGGNFKGHNEESEAPPGTEVNEAGNVTPVRDEMVSTNAENTEPMAQEHCQKEETVAIVATGPVSEPCSGSADTATVECSEPPENDC